MKMKTKPKRLMKNLDIKRIMVLSAVMVRAHLNKFAWLTGLFLIVLPIHLFNIAFSLILITMIMKAEDDLQTGTMYCSLPVPREELVISRFVVSLGIVLAAIAAGVIVLKAAVLFSVAGFYPGSLRITGNIFYVLSPLLTMISIYFPLYSRYGHQPGIQAACYTGLGIVTYLWVWFLYLIVLIPGGGRRIGNPGDSSFSWFTNAVLIVKQSALILGSHFFNLLLATILGLFLLTALRLSLKYYSQREF